MTTERPSLSQTEGQAIAPTGAAVSRATDPGDRVVVLGRNHARIVDAVLGILLADRIPVLLNPDLAADSLSELLTDADPAMVLTDSHYATRLSAWRPWLLEDVADPTVAADPPDSAWPRARPMHYTSGTTGRSKGVYSGRLDQDEGRFLAEEERATWGFEPSDIHLAVSPLSHSAPLRFAQNTLLYGGRVLVLDRFDPEQFLAVVEHHAVTTTFVTPTHLRRLTSSSGWSERDLSSLRLVAHAGAPCPTSVKAAALDRLPDRVWEFYGATEGQFTTLPPSAWPEHPRSVGRARSGRNLVIARDDTICPAGEIGTIWSSCPPAARFVYWRDEAKTRTTWRERLADRPGPWFTVGDLGSLDDHGYLTIAGRRTDLIITGGVNVYPAEIERTLLDHPDVVEAAVFGTPDDDWGQRVCAAVVPRSGSDPDPSDLRRWLRSRLAGFQTPKAITVLACGLPRNAAGKLRRESLPAWTADNAASEFFTT